MAIKTDAMIAHNGAEGYTIHVEYDPVTEDFAATAVFNDGTEKSIGGTMGAGNDFDMLLDGSLVNLKNDNVTRVHSYGCSQMQNLVSVDLPNVTVLGTRALYLNPLLEIVNIPKVENIGGSALEGTGKMQSIVMPAVSIIGNTALKGCTMLKYAYIGASASSISQTAFNDDTDLTIDCGFASTDPAAANAPWGATNATINYGVSEPNPPVGLSITPDPGLIQNIDLEPLEEIQPVEPEPLEVKKTTRKAAK